MQIQSICTQSVKSVVSLALLIVSACATAFATDAGGSSVHRGYYTYPAIRGENIVFTSKATAGEVR